MILSSSEAGVRYEIDLHEYLSQDICAPVWEVVDARRSTSLVKDRISKAAKQH